MDLAGRRDLQRANVIERVLAGIEIGVLPHGEQLGIADGVGPGGVGDVDRGAHRGSTRAVGADSTTVRNRYVAHALLARAAVIEPALDDLDTVEVAADLRTILALGFES